VAADAAQRPEESLRFADWLIQGGGFESSHLELRAL